MCSSDLGIFVAPGAPTWFDPETRIATFAGLLRSNLLGVALTAARGAEGANPESARRCVDYVWATLLPARGDSSGK